MSRYGSYGFRPYVPVATRRANAKKHAAKIANKEKRTLAPISIPGRKIANTFWGIGWCENLERYSDFANRLPRGRAYARNGAIVDLQINAGQIQAIVSGSEIYQVKIEISKLKPGLWKQIKIDCSESIVSLMDLLAGKFSNGVMSRLTQPADGLFPQPSEIKIRCSCPDWAVLCKHAAACLYGVGARLDEQPELLFRLRGVDHHELVSEAVTQSNLQQTFSGGDSALQGVDLGAMFGIELDAGQASKTTGHGRGANTSPASSPKKNTPSTKVKTTSPPATRAKKVTTPKAKSTAKAATPAATKPTKAVSKTDAQKGVAKKVVAKKAGIKKVVASKAVAKNAVAKKTNGKQTVAKAAVAQKRRKTTTTKPAETPIGEIMILL